MTESINGFELVSEFTNAGGGQSRWTFARRGGVEYFIKEFLSPKYPVEGSPGSSETKRDKAERCRVFENHHQELTAALAGLGSSGGGLVVTKFFFRHGTKYYRVTDKVDVSSLSTDGISALPRVQQIAIAVAVTHSLKILHQKEIVHGDLKPPNVLINDQSRGYSTKLIDFDNAFFAGRPPVVEDLVGDPAYLSPELLAYVNGEGDGAEVGLASDVFALGVLFLAYFGADVRRTEATGRVVYPAEAVLDGVDLTAGLVRAWPRGAELVAMMLRTDPAARPSVNEIHTALKRLKVDPECDVLFPAPPSIPAEPVRPAPEPFTGESRVKTKMTPRPREPVPEPVPGPGGGSRLRSKTFAPRLPVPDGPVAAAPDEGADEEIVPRPRLRGRLTRPAPPPPA